MLELPIWKMASRTTKKDKLTNLLFYIIKVTVVLLLIIPTYLYVPYQSPDDIKLFITNFGMVAPFVFILICTIKPMLFFVPFMGLTVVAGTLFGPIYGTVYVIVGGAGSTAVGFYMTRWFSRQSLERFLNGRKRLLELDKKMESEGFKTTLMLRFFSLPWDVVSYSAGLSRIRFKDFYLASLIALVPTSFMYTYFGSSLLNPISSKFIISLLLIIALGSIPHILRRLGWKVV